MSTVSLEIEAAILDVRDAAADDGGGLNLDEFSDKTVAAINALRSTIPQALAAAEAGARERCAAYAESRVESKRADGNDAAALEAGAIAFGIRRMDRATQPLTAELLIQRGKDAHVAFWMGPGPLPFRCSCDERFASEEAHDLHVIAARRALASQQETQ